MSDVAEKIAAGGMRIERLSWMIAHLAAQRGYCPRGPLRVMYADIYPPASKHDRRHGTASAGKKSSFELGQDLRALSQLGVIERRDVRVIVTDWERLHLLALRARAA